MIKSMPVGTIWSYSAIRYLSVVNRSGEGSSDLAEIIIIHTGWSEVRLKHAYF